MVVISNHRKEYKMSASIKDYILWLDDCDDLLLKYVGFYSQDLPSWRWPRAYATGLTPDQAVAAFIENQVENNELPKHMLEMIK